MPFSGNGPAPTWPPSSPLPVGDHSGHLSRVITPRVEHPTSFQIRQASYPLWMSKLTTLVLRSRCSFSAFLHVSIRASLSPEPRARRTPSLFPVPVPLDGAFRRMPAGLSSAKRRTLHLGRALHICCMALNFWYYGGEFVDEGLLRREPNPSHALLSDSILCEGGRPLGVF